MNYFIRHTDRLDMAEEDFTSMWKNNIFGIHFGSNYIHHESELLDENSSIYQENSGKRALNLMKKLAEYGGYIWCDYLKNVSIVGKVASHSEVFLEKISPSRNIESYKHGILYLKCLKMKDVRYINTGEFLSLKARKPRQGTFVNWAACNNSLIEILENRYSAQNCEDLSVDQQEVLVYEYLRRHANENFRIECLLMPIGRTLKDIDIYGIGINGQKIFVQVTNHELNQSSLTKIQNLRKYKADSNVLIFVSGIKNFDLSKINEKTKRGVIFMNINEIFDESRKLKFNNKEFLKYLFE